MPPVSLLKNLLILVLFTFVIGCNNNKTTTLSEEDSVATKTDSMQAQTPATPTKEDTVTGMNSKPSATDSLKTYANQRFKNVTVTKKGVDSFLIKGQGQIFEASFSWVIEDGHEELQQGHTMTDEGAPEWGNFSFTVVAPKKRANSTLHLILFEASAKDGSRQYQLPVLLY